MGRRNNYVEKLFALNIINSQTDHKPDICFKCNGVAWYCLRLTTLTAVPIYLDFLTRTSWYCVWWPGVYLSDTATLPNDTKTALLYLKNLFPLKQNWRSAATNYDETTAVQHYQELNDGRHRTSEYITGHDHVIGCYMYCITNENMILFSCMISLVYQAMLISSWTKTCRNFKWF
jgi:hypothetical protein